MKGSPFITLFSIMAGVFCLQVTHGHATERNVFAPPDGEVLLVVGQDKAMLPPYVRAVGAVPGGIAVYTSIQNMDGLRRAADHGGGVQHAQYLMNLYPDSAVQVGLYMVDGLEGVLRGVYDDNIKELARWFSSNDRPFYLRVGYEFDNPENHYDPVLYKAAFRYIVDKLRSMNVSNVSFVWHSYGAKIDRPLSDWYPGSDYVDWVALSFFAPYDSSYRLDVVDMAKLKEKPLMIAEAAPMGMGVDAPHIWDIWYGSVFRFIKENDVKIFCYINCDWDRIPVFAANNWKDSRVQSNQEVLSGWKKRISEPDILNASSRLFDVLGYK